MFEVEQIRGQLIILGEELGKKGGGWWRILREINF